MVRKCYVDIDLCQEKETKVTFITPGILVPIWDTPGRDKLKPNIVAPERKNSFSDI